MSINILTWNIKAGQHKEGGYPIVKTKNLDRIANVIKDHKVSIVCLQEVDAYTLRSGIYIHQAKYIANKLSHETGKAWSYEFVISKNMKPGYFGNAIISCYPMEASLKLPLPSMRSNEDRSFLLTRIQLKAFPIYVGTFHLGLKGDQILQAQKIKTVLKDYSYFSKKVILAGDLNAKEGSEAYYIMQRREFSMVDVGPIGACTLNCFEDCNNPKIDFCFVRGFSLHNLKSQVLPIDISDHRPILLELCN
jgi:endonuclease/exonuclease/phosphatase family metal-dependent hydrolase